MPKIMLNYRPNEQKRLRSTLKEQLNEAKNKSIKTTHVANDDNDVDDDDN